MKNILHISLKIQFVFFAILFLFPAHCYSQKLKLQVVENQKIVQSKTLRSNTSDLQIKSHADKLKTKLITKGYLACSIDSIRANSIYLNRGLKYQFVDFVFDFPTDLKIKSNQPASLKKITKLENSILSHQRSQGFVEAQLLKSVLFDSNRISINYTLEKNERYYFDSIIFDENLVHYNYISQLLGIKISEPANYLKLENIENIFKKNQLFKLDSSKTTTSDHKIRSHLYLKPNKINSFNGILGIQTNNKNKVETTGNIELSLSNTLKQGEQLIFEWKKSDPLSQLLHISASLPFIYKTPIGINSNFELRKQDSSYTNTNILGGLTIPLADYGELSVNVLSKNSTISNQTDSLVLKSSKAILYGLGYRYNSLNNFINPSSGWLLKTAVFLGQKKNEYNMLSKHTSFQSELELLIQHPVKLPLGNLFLSSNSGLIFNDSLTISHLYALGGIKNLRGFNEQSVFAKAYAIFSFEGRFSIDAESYTYLFYDFAFTHEIDHKNFTTNQRQALGLGLKINTKAGLIHVAYAIGKTNSENYNLKSAKIHVGYVAMF